MKLSEITTATFIPNGCQNLGEFYEGEREWSIAEAFRNLKKDGVARLFSREMSRDEFDAHISELACTGLRNAEAGFNVKVGEVLALWYVARCNEINEEYMCDMDMTTQKYAARLAGAKRQITNKYS